jgi:hypothetical protein
MVSGNSMLVFFRAKGYDLATRDTVRVQQLKVYWIFS